MHHVDYRINIVARTSVQAGGWQRKRMECRHDDHGGMEYEIRDVGCGIQHAIVHIAHCTLHGEAEPIAEEHGMGRGTRDAEYSTVDILNWCFRHDLFEL